MTHRIKTKSGNAECLLCLVSQISLLCWMSISRLSLCWVSWHQLGAYHLYSSLRGSNLTGSSSYDNNYGCKKFYITGPWKDLNVVMLSVIMLSVVTLASSLPDEQIPARGTGRYDNIYSCKKFYISGPWKGSNCRYAECHFAECHGTG